MMQVKPDGFFGMVMSIEGIEDSAVLLHGPDGCRKNLAALTGKVYPRPDPEMTLGMPFYQMWSRIPCTGIESQDYIYGSYYKIDEALQFVGVRSEFVAVVNTPGASLIGDDCQKAIDDNGLSDKAIVLDADLSSQPISIGVDAAMVAVLDKMMPEQRTVRPGTVNLLGNNVLQKDWETINEEFTHIMGLMGLEVVSCVGAGSSIANLKESATAEFNVVLLPEYSEKVAGFYKGRYGIESVCIGCAPVGFEATDNLIKAVAEATGRDPSAALAYVDHYRKRAYRRMLAMRYGVDGYSLAVDCDPSAAYPLVSWLYEDLKIIPAYVRTNGVPYGPAEEKLRAFLEERDLSDVLMADLPDFVDLFVSDGNTAIMYERSGHCRRGIDIGFPSMMNVDFMEQPIYGPLGAMYLLERAVNRFRVLAKSKNPVRYPGRNSGNSTGSTRGARSCSYSVCCWPRSC